MKARDFFIGFVAGALVVISIQAGGRFIDTKNKDVCSQPFDIDGVAIKVNELRLSNNKPQLLSYPDLAKYAQLRADEIASTGDVNHESKYGDFSKWASNNTIAITVPYESIGEELDGPQTSACSTVDEWKGSPTHFSALTSDRFVGFGVGVKNGYSVVILGNLK